MNEPMAGVAKLLKGFPWRYGVGRAGSTAAIAYYLIWEWDAISGCRLRSTQNSQIENLNRRNPALGSGFRDRGGGGGILKKTVYPPANRAAQITRSFASKDAIRQCDG
jgi:hypothetical protein